ncbi:complex I NDUFA9 subunit family protein [Desulfurispira natronophila]|uniref:NADH dehydrogenase n=1 Tax=Desulfurispira natronophila TaxID=682562 RepID=A0A7W7Y3J4_9BACT|nr:complex I NDUFA9 subunit family protein [Desulfurispira natronophila]MBB5021446.1 NADH dehydrogenase [Desulfurispira natronophila]
MKIAVTGGTGFVGSRIVKELVSAGHEVRLLVRKPLSPRAGVETVMGNVEEPDSLLPLVNGCDAIIHLVGIIREFPPTITYEGLHSQATQNMLQVARAEGVKRFVHMSALGSSLESNSAYHRTKCAAEQAVRQSELDYTIFKPSVIFGPQDEFINMLLRFLRMPVVPIIGDGKYQLQPVSVENIAQAFTRCLGQAEAVGKTYEVGGPKRYSYVELVDSLAQLKGKAKPLKIHQPVSLMEFSAKTLGRFAFFPISTDQLRMLLQGSTTDETDVFTDFDIAPWSLEDKFNEYYC